MRPLMWALATAVIAAVSAAGTAERMAERFGLTTPTLNAVGDGGVVTVAADLSGHFTVHPTLDGRRVRMMVDTGASLVALSYEDAQRAGIRVEPRDFTRRTATANGTVEVAPVRIAELRLGDIAVRNVDAFVLPQGRLGVSLLGMSFLKRIGGFEIARGQLTLRQ